MFLTLVNCVAAIFACCRVVEIVYAKIVNDFRRRDRLDYFDEIEHAFDIMQKPNVGAGKIS
jgi:hypothetical protein